MTRPARREVCPAGRTRRNSGREARTRPGPDTAALRRPWGQSDAHVGTDPATMPAEARLGELGAILARGYRRLLAGRNALAESGEPEAQCDPAVDGDGAEPAEEVA